MSVCACHPVKCNAYQSRKCAWHFTVTLYVRYFLHVCRCLCVCVCMCVCEILWHFFITVCARGLCFCDFQQCACVCVSLPPSVFPYVYTFVCVCVCVCVVCPKLPVQKTECVLSGSWAAAALLPLTAAITHNLMGNSWLLPWQHAACPPNISWICVVTLKLISAIWLL